MSRPPSPPPELPGFTFVEPLGTGGFADVFLYEQQMPKRRVAVKVLLADRISSGAAQEFADEANVMAMLSTHPAIVTIYQAGVAGDGRPYLVMEYCPRPNLQIRARKEPFSVAEALRVGIQVAGAVETAHRAGVLHRDIKPANILVTEYNRPALTDFGIASTTGAVSEATGMSIPWSPPEFFADPPQSGQRSDVFALGATLYTLLAGRSPFERPGERNTSADLIERIERASLPSLSRPDSPGSLQQVLERAMAKNPEARYPSAVAFARALQKVQIELTHSVTPIDIVDDHPLPEDLEDDDEGLTRVRNVVSIEPDAGNTRPSATTRQLGTPQPAPSVDVPGPRFEAAASPAVEDTVVRPSTPAAASAPVDDDRTVVRGPRTLSPEAPPAPTAPGVPAVEPVTADAKRRPRAGMWIGIAAAAVVLVGGVIVGVNLLNGTGEPDPVATQDEVVPQNPVSEAVPTVDELAGTREGTAITFNWTNPSPEDGDLYLWNTVDLAGDGGTETTKQTTVTFQGAASGQVCIDVMLRRGDGRASEPVRGCVE
ncbi:serine/threonine-protein kinase [Microbacterium aerolatum]|uniref:non-specific serine/threonine protein kinase n=1 Tax=Microbacterium aerolatum TaxID=153731 RepID=A0A511ABG2_9MICO|nr:serine/threonine-protein kinase [Microbacterium aerolatum]GEK85518.1 serine/threonine protein kinase [Microbacterium aerolatum]GGB31699.1 serine/threonine protein kinase [Microbacterium aerolatum]